MKDLISEQGHRSSVISEHGFCKLSPQMKNDLSIHGCIFLACWCCASLGLGKSPGCALHVASFVGGRGSICSFLLALFCCGLACAEVFGQRCWRQLVSAQRSSSIPDMPKYLVN